MSQRQIIVITGPSGVGKGTLCRKLRERFPSLKLSVSATSRPRRPEEEHGKDYYFVSREEFRRMAEEGDMLEWAEYNDNYYGTPRKGVEDQLAQGNGVILEIETQGALRVKELFPEATLIFLMPPSMAELRKRLEGRGTNTEDDIRSRLAISEQEIALREYFSHVVVNDDLEDCYRQLEDLVAGKIKAV